MKRRDFFKNMVGAGIAAMVLPGAQWIGKESKAATILDEGTGLRFFDDWVLNVTHDRFMDSTGSDLNVIQPVCKSAKLIVNFLPDEWDAYRKAFSDCKLTECKLRRNYEDFYMIGDFYITTISHNGNSCSAELLLSGALSISAD